MNRKLDQGLPPLRERVDQYSYFNKETIGKGYSSSVYKGKDERTGITSYIKMSK